LRSSRQEITLTVTGIGPFWDYHIANNIWMTPTLCDKMEATSDNPETGQPALRMGRNITIVNKQPIFGLENKHHVIQIALNRSCGSQHQLISASPTFIITLPPKSIFLLLSPTSLVTRSSFPKK